MLSRRKPVVSAILLPLIVGAIGFINLTQRPRFATYHNVDILQLLATGMCFGVALSALVIWARNRSVT
jgi:hypothetical protein